MRLTNGRQTRSTDDVGRPDGCAERASIHGWREAIEDALEAILEAYETPRQNLPAYRSHESAQVALARARAISKGLCRREALYGETAPDEA